MFASAAALMMLQVPVVTVPLGRTPRQIERPRAPIETAGPAWAAACGDSTDWDQPAPPVRIHANTYLVGTCGIASILVTGRDGHVLIDGATEKGAEVIAANIRALGFKLTDVRFLTHSHEHIDHIGGIARLQQLTGAQLVASETVAKVFASGVATPDDPQVGMHPPIPIARVDRVIQDGEDVRLSDLKLTAHATPGHTPGALTWSWTSCDGAVCRDMVFADSLSAISRDDYKFSAHPDYVAAFRNGIAKVAALECDILLTPHPSASTMKERMTGKAKLFDQAGCRDYAAVKAKALDERLAKEGK
jgi:metallo-beta-lactamase class B